MYAVIHTGGKQYKVKEGDILRVEKIPAEKGKNLQFLRVLCVGEGESLKVGTPLVENASVDAQIVGNGRAKKVIVFKKKRRKGYSKKQGHRQDYSEVKILKINA